MAMYEADVDDVEGIRVCAETHGFCLVRNVFSSVEMSGLKTGMAQLDAQFGKDIPDILSCTPISWLITDSRVLKIARRLLGPKLVYYPETNVNYEAEIGPVTTNPFNYLHCDATGMPEDRTKVWRSPTDQLYRGYRFGLYFQDYSRFSGGLKVGVGTHKGDPDAYLHNQGLNNDVRFQIEVEPGRIANIAPAYMELYDVPARPGDLVVWNLRTIHAAGSLILKRHPELSLHPDVEADLLKNIPNALREYVGPRLALFFDFGAPVEEVDLYIKSRIQKLDRSDGARFTHACYDARELTDALQAHGISARYDYLLLSMLLRWITAPAKRAKIIKRTLNLADRHREFSPYFPLFDQTAYAAARGHNDERALKIVFEGIAAQSSVIRKNESASSAPG